MPAAAADSVTLCGYNDSVTGKHHTADFNLTTQAVSNIVKDTGQFKSNIYSMKRHRLLDVVCNASQQIIVSMAGQSKYVSKHQFM